MKISTLISSPRAMVSHLLVFLLVVTTSSVGFPNNSSKSQDRNERNQRETSQRRGDSSRSSHEEIQESGFVTYAEGDRSICRDMSQEEVQRIRRAPEQIRQMRVITEAEREEVLGRRQTEANVEATNLKIILRSTAQLDGFPEAKAAFIRAAATWESQIKNPISIIMDVDYGPTRFGQTYPTGVLGSTSTPSYVVSYSTMRSSLLSSASSPDETTLYNALPTNSVSTDIGAISKVHGAGALMRAFGLLPADAASTDPAPAIGFNSNFSFDFDPSNGITAGQTDFDAVAVHEMGHALGFLSNVGAYGTTATANSAVSVWDIFRFRPGTTMATFTSAQRILTTGGEQRFYDGHPELATSTGSPSGTGGDGRQASHWKDDSQSGTYIGIMDPTLASGVRKTMTASDLQMLETVGYTISGTLPPPPCTYSLSATNASATTAGGTGTVGVTASASTCTWSATSNAAWITVTSGTPAAGNGTVGYSVQANTGASRSGTITIAGQTFTVNQSGCSFTLSYTTNSFPATASTGSVTVTASGSNCPWTAVSNTSWINVTAGATGTGNGTVTYTLDANTSTSSRSGSLTIAGRSFTVTQAGVPCTYTVGNFTTNFTSSGGSVNIPVTTSSSCSWRATENVNWLSFSPSTTVTGSGNVRLTVNAKNSSGSRSTTVTIAGKSFTITQTGR